MLSNTCYDVWIQAFRFRTIAYKKYLFTIAALNISFLYPTSTNTQTQGCC